MTGHITGQMSTFMALSGLAATNALLSDVRPAWVWADDGMTVLWSNPAGAAFFGVESLTDLADLGGLARAPARPHIARVALSGPQDRDSTERLRFYRGLRVMLVTCTCRKLSLPDGKAGALIIANDAPKNRESADSAAALAGLVQDPSLGAVTLFTADGSVLIHDGALAPPRFEQVRERLLSAKHGPVHADLKMGEPDHAAEILMLDSGEILVIVARDPLLETAPAQAAADAASIAEPEQSSPTLDDDGDDPEPASVSRKTWPARAGGLFGFASATRFLSPSAQTQAPGNTADAISSVVSETTDALLEDDTADAVADTERTDDIDGGFDDIQPVEEAASVALDAPSDEAVGDTSTDTLAATEIATEVATSDIIPSLAPLSAADPLNEVEVLSSENQQTSDDPSELVLPDAAVVETAPQDALDDAPQADLASVDISPVEDAAEEDTPNFFFERRDRPVRFAWKMDVDRRFTFLSPDFAEVLGPQAADVVGLTWEEVAERFALDPDGRVAAALGRRDTWSGRSVDWPVSGQALRVPVDMAALPAFDRYRVFEGFRGFGVCRTADAFDDPAATGETLRLRPVVTQVAATTKPEPSLAVPGSVETPIDEAIDPNVSESAAPGDLDAGQVHGAHEIESALDAEMASDVLIEDAIDDSMIDATPLLQAPGLDDTFLTDSRSTALDVDADVEGAASDALDALEISEGSEHASGIDDPDAADLFDEPSKTTLSEIGVEHAEQSIDLVAETEATPDAAMAEPIDDASQQDETVTALTPAAQETALAASRLSKPDREAFRKIAEALGARNEDETPESDTGAPDAPGALIEGDGEADETAPPADAIGENDNVVVVPGAFASQPTPAIEETTPRAARTGLLDRLPVGVAIVAGHEVGYANATLLNLLGYTATQELNDAGGLEALFAEPEEWPSAVPGAESERTMRLNLADGTTRPVKARLHSVPWNGETALMMSLLDRHDPAQEAALDRLHEVQTSLSTAETHLAEMDAVLETATDGVLLLDDAAGIVKVNRSAEALFNASREEIVGEALTTLLAPESHRDATDYFDGLARNGVASILNDGREVIGQVRGGGLIPLFMTIGRVGETEEGPRYCAVVRDITQWKTAEEELTDAKRQAETASSKKSDFLAKISHEIRTPLNAIIGFSEVMMEERFGPIGNDRYKGYLRDIHNSGSHIMSLINDLLDLSKIEAGKLDLTFEAVSTNDIIRECVALMQPQANRDRVIIRASLPSAVPSIVADGRSIRQVVLNLLSNAIKFNQPGGQVIVSTALEDSGEVMLRVRDTGLGMTQKDLAAAMEPFRQLHTARHGGGTGLGLPLTKALVEANRASFRIDSELHQGTLVEITFPQQRVLAE